MEAKRDAVHFEIPVRKKKDLLVSIRQLMGLCNDAKAAIEQVQGYCGRRGVRYAAICNGPQLIVFVATRTDGKIPFDGRALVIDGFEQLREEFPLIFNLISPLGVLSNKLLAHLDANGIAGIPEKYRLVYLIILQFDIKAHREMTSVWWRNYFLRTSHATRN